MTSPCNNCDLLGSGLKINPKGSSNPELYVLGDLTNSEDIESREPLSSTNSSNEYLRMVLNSVEFNEDNTRFFNVVRCKINNRSKDQVNEYRKNCIEFAKKDICRTNPKLILVVGGAVSKLLLGDNEVTNITSVRGTIFNCDINGTNYKVEPIYNPKFVLNNPYHQKDLMDDVAKARSFIEGKLIDISNKVLTSARNYDQFKEFYDKYLVNSVSPGFDLETNAEEPHSDKIKIIGFSFGADDGIHGIYVVRNSLEYNMPDDDYQKIVDLSCKILNDKVIRVHNIKYEWPVTYNCWNQLVAKDTCDFDDSLIKARMLLGGKTGAGLKPRCQSELGYPDWETDLYSYSSSFNNLLYGLRKTPAGKDRWDYEKFNSSSTFVQLSEMYHEYTDLDKRSTTNMNSIDSIIEIISKYYTSSESLDILDAVHQKILNLVDTQYSGPFSYAFVPMKIIEKYGAMDSIGCIDLNNHYDQKLEEYSKKMNIDLIKGYEYFKRHYLLSAWMEINGIFWNDKIATHLRDWYNSTCIKATREMLDDPHMRDYIFDHQKDLYNQYIVDDHLDVAEQYLGSKITQIQKYKIVLEDGRKISKKNIIYEMGDEFINSHKDDIINYAVDCTKDYTEYAQFKWLFNPGSPSSDNTDLVNSIMINDNIKIAKMYYMMSQIIEDPEFDRSKYDRGSLALFTVIHDANEYKKYLNADKSDDKDSTELSSNNIFKDCDNFDSSVALNKFSELLNSTVNITNPDVIKIATEALNYKLSSCDEPTMIELSNYFLLSGIDYDNPSTWTPGYKFLFYFRLWKKCNKMVTSYIDGSKVGRGTVYKVSTDKINTGELLAKRQGLYDNEKSESTSFLMQPSFNTCGVNTYRWSCLSGETRIPLLDGTSPTMEELSGRSGFWVYSYDQSSNSIVPGYAKYCGVSGTNAPLLRVTLDNKEYFDCTPEHRVMRRNGHYVKAENLEVGDSIMPFYRKLGSESDTTNTYLESGLPFNNHKVVSIEPLGEVDYVYDIEVEKYHNFALDCGIFVHNSGIHTLPTGSDIKEIFTPRYPHGSFFCPDASQAEVRFLAGLSGCESLLEAFRNGEDVHLRNASLVFGKPPEEITSAERRYAKMCCVVGSTIIKLADGTKRSIEDLYKDGIKDFYLYSFDIDKKKVVPGHAINLDLTMKTNVTYKITFDNGKVVETTHDHRFLLTSGKYKYAEDLESGDQVETLFYRVPTKGAFSGGLYEQIRDVRHKTLYGDKAGNIIHPRYGAWRMTHQEFYNSYNTTVNDEVDSDTISNIDHINNNSLDNTKDNLRMISKSANLVKNKHKSSYDKYGLIGPASHILKYILDNDLGVSETTYERVRKELYSGRGVARYSTIMKYYTIQDLIDHDELDRVDESLFIDPIKGKFNQSRIASRTVVKVDRVDHPEPIPMYDITVDTYHNYAIDLGDNSAVFTHNTFSLIYGSTADSFADKYLHGDHARGRAIFRAFYDAYPEIEKFMNDRHQEMKQHGYITNKLTPLFMYCSPEMYNGNENQAKRISGNAPIQSFNYDTEILGLDGKYHKIGELADNKEDLWTYSYDVENNRVVPTKGIQAQCTGVTSTWYEIVLDNNQSVKVTPEHLMMLRSGEYIRADKLKIGDRLMPYYQESDKCNISESSSYGKILSHLVFEELTGIDILDFDINIHHIDFDHSNNHPDNLLGLSNSIHRKYHSMIDNLCHSGLSEEGFSIIEELLYPELTRVYGEDLANSKLKLVKDFHRNILSNDNLLVDQLSHNSMISKNQRRSSDYQDWDKNQRKAVSELCKSRMEKSGNVLGVSQERLVEIRKKVISDHYDAFLASMKKGHNTDSAKSNHRLAYEKNCKNNPDWIVNQMTNQIIYYIDNNLDWRTPDDWDNNRYDYTSKAKKTSKYILSKMDWSEFLERADNIVKSYNHKVKDVIIHNLSTPEPKYDLHIPKYHNFVLRCGVFTHNSGSSMVVGLAGYQIMKYIKEHNMKSKIVCFVHDSLEMDIHPEELIELSSVVIPLMNDYPDKEFGVPMKTHLILGPSFGQEIEMDKFDCNEDYSECTMEGEGTKRDIDAWYDNIHDYYEVCDVEVLTAKTKHISWNNLYLPKHAINSSYGTDVVEEKIRVHIKKKCVKSIY